MDKKDFVAQYRSKWWMETSKRIKSRDHNTCQMCGRNDRPLGVHHLCYGENGSLQVEDGSLITLCDECHESQKYYREECNELLTKIRSKLTDFEIYQILQYVSRSFLSLEGIPVMMRSKTEMKLIPKEYADQSEVKMLENLAMWRTPIWDKLLVHDALFEYYVWRITGNNSGEDIRSWFLENFSIEIEEFIERNKDYAISIENEVKLHLTNLKRKHDGL